MTIYLQPCGMVFISHPKVPIRLKHGVKTKQKKNTVLGLHVWQYSLFSAVYLFPKDVRHFIFNQEFKNRLDQAMKTEFY